MLGAVRVRNVTTPSCTHFDISSVTFSTIGFGGLLFGLSNLGDDDQLVGGWTPLCIGVLALFLFAMRQITLQKRDSALLDLRTFLSPTFTLSLMMMAISTMALFGTLIVLPIYLQTVLGLDALSTGLFLLPGGLASGLLAPIVGRIYDRSGPTALLVTGSVTLSGVFWGMTMLNQNTSVGLVLVGHILLGVGLSLLFTPLFTVGLGSLSPSLYSHGSAIVGTTQQVAGAIGTALFVTVMTAGSTTPVASGASAIAATVGGIQNAFFCGAVISLFAIIAAFFVRKPADTEAVTPRRSRATIRRPE